MDIKKELDSCQSIDDLMGKNGLVQRLIGSMIEKMLEKELEGHLGYIKHSSRGHRSGNSRNGKTSKTVHSNYGAIDINVPRDRQGNFEPQVVRKRETRISDFDNKIISMYARGMSTRDIQAHVEQIYGAKISPAMVSAITDKVTEAAREWQSRPLQRLYPIAYFDAIHYKVREGGKVASKAVYTCLGIDLEGNKEVLGLWIGESEGAKFWLRVFSELKNRGVEDIFISCVDGLKGMPEAIKAVFPETTIQLCIVHMIRNSIKYVSHKNLKEFMASLKFVYQAKTESEGEGNLLKFQEEWGDRYPLAVNPWVKHWENIKTFFQFPDEIRRIIYTTNAVESLHRHFRKATKTRTVFPTDESLLKLLFLTVRNLSEKWTMPIQNWKSALSQFAILYEDRIESKLIR